MVDVRLTKEVREIVNKFYSSNRNVFASADNNLRLAASLYAARNWSVIASVSNIEISSNNRSCEVKQILNILDEYVTDLTKYLDKHDILLLLQNYSAVIDYCLNLYDQPVKTDGCLTTQPYELTEFCSDLLGLDKGCKVYNPFGGLGTFAIKNPQCSFRGEELNAFSWAMLQVRLDAFSNDSVYACSNSFDELEKTCNSYDCVISNPPYGIRRQKYSEFDVIKLAIDNKLKDGGSFLIVLPMAFCYGVKYKPIREYLIDNGYLTAVISLPNIFAPMTQVKTCVVVAKKERQNGFLLVDGSKFMNDSALGKGVFAYKLLLEAIDNHDDKVCTGLLTRNDLDSNMELTPSRLVYKLPEIKNPVKIGELISVYDDLSLSVPTWTYSFKDLEWSNSVLKIGKPDVSKRQRCFKYKESCLISRIGSGVTKTGVLKDAANGDLIALGIFDFAYQVERKDLISDTYLRLVLESEYVTEQINVFSRGNVIPRLSHEDFLGITIPLPSIEEQEKIVKEKLDKIMQQAGVTDTYSDLGHMTSTPFSKIGSALDTLEESNNLSLDDRSVLKYVKVNIKFISRLIDINMGLKIWEKEHSDICLYSFIKNYIEEWDMYGSQTFNIEFSCDDILKDACVSCNFDALTIMFDCLLDNANRHGFLKKYTPNNKVRIDLKVYYEKSNDESVNEEQDRIHSNVLLCISNNGKEMSPGFKKEDYITKGRFSKLTGRTGLGGYHVYSIVKSMNGNMLSIDNVQGWTKFQFLIPISLLNK